jgi:Tryptophan-associated transmembrane protein (Trp_oprn_chp)
VLLAAAGIVLGVRGHRMPRLGRRYQALTARRNGPGQVPPEERFWERMNAGEDPTSSGHPR